MDTVPPTSSSRDTPASPAAGPRHFLWTVACLLGCPLTFGILGLSIGAALGKYVPSYYRTVFRHGSDPDFDPVAMGIGQGLTQGLALGAVIGLVLAALYWWRAGFSQRTTTSEACEAASSGASRRSIGLLLAVGGLFAICAGVPAFGVGYVAGMLGSDIDRGSRQLDAVERIIAADPSRYGALTINHGPAGKFILEGSVRSQADFDDLHDRLVREFGEYEAEFVMGGVEINDSAAADGLRDAPSGAGDGSR